MSLRNIKMPSAQSAQYHSLKQTADGYVDLRFEQTIKRRFPFRTILLSIALFTLGTLFLVLGILLITGYIAEEYRDRTWPVIILGLIMFIPGFYHVRIAYYAYRGYEGYSYDDIPDYD